MVALDKILSMGQRELFDIYTECKQMLCSNELLEIELFNHLIVWKNDWCLIKLLEIPNNTWNHLSVCKWMNRVE